MREVNAAGKALITQFEGVRLTRYEDQAERATIGIGHLITPQDNIGEEITQEQCETLFEGDLSHAARTVERLVTTPLTDNQFAALVSFVFNLGGGALGRSTLLRKLDAGDYAGAAAEFGKWIYADAEASNGLIARRDAEKELFLTPDTLTT